MTAKLKIIFENSDFLVLEKPAGLLVHQTKHQKENTLVNFLLDKYPEIRSVGQKDRPGIVHRLDQDVSGLMVIAKNQKAYEHLIKQFQENKVKKKYLALAHGKPPEERGIIEAPLGRTKSGKLVVVRSHKKVKFEKPALTRYRILRKFKKHTLLEIEPLTGRTHQIRLHLKSLGCPIVGDKQYGKTKDDFKRIFLYAYYLGFYDLNNQWREFEINLEEELKKFLWELT
jgi:23S rRNA pseudouridine1911/1915/1917 synthase